ncbi:kinase-like domain-containing protein [Collybia nuda]|uniref:Kinase-like domain-containing protein n=1 Tax=Collybia nuda TaxID=64659 RepID=A0A9P5YAW1_9AGAR|nr:kinase-like domain-containing protein [Collybia nuda]
MVMSNRTCRVIVKVSRTLASGLYDVARAREQFNREVSIVKGLNHPNIAEYLGVTDHLGQPAIIVAWYPHDNAPAFLMDRSIDIRLHVIKGVIEGLCYLHSKSPAIAHGDIRGNNVFVNNSFEGVLSDFALSQVVDDGFTPPTDLADTMDKNGCIRWMARELIYDEPEVPSPIGLTLASDTWAFGCTFYELLLGQVPYSLRKKHFSHIIHDIVKGVFPFSKADTTRVGCNEAWPVVSGCWRKVPGDRPSIFEIKAKLSHLYD